MSSSFPSQRPLYYQTDASSLNDDQQVLDQFARMPDWDGRPVMFQFHLMSAHILRKNETKPGPFQPAVRYGLGSSRDIKYWIDRNSGQDHISDLNSDPHEDRDLREVVPQDQLAALRARERAETSFNLAVH